MSSHVPPLMSTVPSTIPLSSYTSPAMLVSSMPSRLPSLDEVIAGIRKKFPELVIATTVSERLMWATVQGQLRATNPLPRPRFNPRLVLSCEQGERDIHFTFEAHLISLKEGNYSTNSLEMFSLIQTLLPNSGFVLCCGVEVLSAS